MPITQLPLRERPIEALHARSPQDVVDGVILFPQVVVDGLDGLEVAPLDRVELEPGLLLL